MAADALTLDAPAKVNLALSVGSPDPETGMHPVASWMVAIDFCDTVRLERTESGGSALRLAYADDAPRAEGIDWPAEKDLAWRALAAMERCVDRTLPTRISIGKRIPTGAGLGGGSSDAAAALVGLDELWQLGLSTQALAEVAATLGSDVPFLVHAMLGEPSMVATGLGEVLRPAKLLAPVHLVLVLPDCKCPTGPVYGAFDAMLDGVERSADAAAIDALTSRAACTSVDGLFNDLAEPAMRVVPALREAATAMSGVVGGEAVRVTGSGSTLFTVVRSDDASGTLVDRLRSAGQVAVATRTLIA